MTGPFWEGIENHRLLLQYDRRAEKYQFRPRPLSIYGSHDDLEWREATGRGQVFSHTIVPQPPIDGAPQAPKVLAAVQLDEGVRMFAPLLNVDSGEVRTGLAVEICWPDDTGDDAPFAFQPQPIDD